MSAALAAVLLAGGAQAQHDSESSLPERAALNRMDISPRSENADGQTLGIDFSFRGEQTQQEDPGFLYLDFEAAAADSGSLPVVDGAGFTPRSTATSDIQTTLGVRGLSRSSRTFTPRYAGATVSLGAIGESRDMPAIDISLSSQFTVSEPELSVLTGITDGLTPLDRQSMNVGLSVGYSGFHIGASLTRETGGFESGYAGINLGLGYAWSDFSTEISVGDYSVLEGGNSLAGLTDYGSFQKLELGAAYAVSERLRFSGGVRLFDYSKRLGLTGQPERSGVLYLGTRLNF